MNVVEPTESHHELSISRQERLGSTRRTTIALLCKTSTQEKLDP